MDEIDRNELDQELDLVTGHVPRARTRALRREIAREPRRERRLARLEEIVTAMRSDRAAAAPRAWIERASTLADRPARQVVRTAIAEILLDTATSGAGAGVRRARSDARQLVLGVAGLEVEVRVSSPDDDDPWKVTGMLVWGGDPPEGVVVSLEEARGDPLVTSPTASGEFWFTNRPRRCYRICVSWTGGSMASPELDPD